MENRKLEWRPEHSILWAHTSCLCLGICLVLMGIAPALIDRVVSGDTPELITIAIGSIAFLFGGTFIGLHVLVRHRVYWAAWAAFILAMALCFGAMSAILTTSTLSAAVFLLVLAANVSYANWLAILAIWRHRRQYNERGPVATGDGQ